jgi:hypothetical protein
MSVPRVGEDLGAAQLPFPLDSLVRIESLRFPEVMSEYEAARRYDYLCSLPEYHPDRRIVLSVLPIRLGDERPFGTLVYRVHASINGELFPYAVLLTPAISDESWTD